MSMLYLILSLYVAVSSLSNEKRDILQNFLVAIKWRSGLILFDFDSEKADCLITVQVRCRNLG